MAISTFKRYENKYMITKEQLDELMPILMEHMELDGHCTSDKGYNVYNVYYDTIDNELIRKSTSKPYYKEKLRIRSYVIPKTEDKIFLEMKKKIDGVVNKRRATVTLEEAYNFIDKGIRPNVTKYIDNQVLNEMEQFLKHYKIVPTAFISYSRIALFDKIDKDFRMTFDNEIRVRRTNVRLENGEPGDNILDPNLYIMEVKVISALPLWFVRELSRLKIYRRGFSKYGYEYKNIYLPKQRLNKIKGEEK